MKSKSGINFFKMMINNSLSTSTFGIVGVFIPFGGLFSSQPGLSEGLSPIILYTRLSNSLRQVWGSEK